MAAKKRAKKARKARARRSKRAKSKAPARRAAKKKGARRPAARKAAPVARAVPNAIGCTMQHMDYTTHSMDEVKRFYTEVLGFSSFQLDPRFNYLSVVTGPSSSLGFMPPIPGPPEQWRPPREPAIYLVVKDVDRAYRALLAKGMAFQQEPTDMPWMHRCAILKDPEGRTVYLAQPVQR